MKHGHNPIASERHELFSSCGIEQEDELSSAQVTPV